MTYQSRQRAVSTLPKTNLGSAKINPNAMASPVHARASVSTIAERLVQHLGRTLTAQIGGTTNLEDLDLWTAGDVTPEAASRLRLGRDLVGILAHEDPRLVQGWFKSLNSGLRDRSPLACLRTPDATRAELIRAAHTFADRG